MKNPIYSFIFLLIALISAYGQSKSNLSEELLDKISSAISKNDLATLKDLFENNIPIDSEPRSHTGWTPLMQASTQGKTEIVEYLLSKGANPNKMLDDGQSVLMQAAQTDDAVVIVKALIQAGANVNVRNKEGITPLMRFAWMSQPDSVKALLDANADPSIKDKDGQTAFHFAVAYGDAESTRLLMKSYGDLNRIDGNGETSLMWVGWGERSGVLKVLLDAGADPNIVRKKDGVSPLMISSYRLFRDEVRLLLERGANVHAKNKNSRNALMYLAESRFRFDEIGAHGDGNLVWTFAFRIIEDLVKAGVNINDQDKDGNTALMIATKANNPHFADTLVRLGANEDLKNKDGKTVRDFETRKYIMARETLRNMIRKAN